MNHNDHPRGTQPMGSGGPQGPVAPRYGSPPPAPQGRQDELMTGGSQTVYEFTGAAAEQGPPKGTFIGSTLDLSSESERRDSNLRSGPSGWLFAGVAAVLTVGAIVYVMMAPDKSEATPTEDDPAAVAAADQAVTPPAEGEAKEAEPAAAGSGGDETDSEAGTGTQPEDPKPAEAPAAAEEVDEPEDPKPAEEPKAPEEPKKPAEPKKTSGTKSTKKKSTKSSTKKKRKTLSPKKPPRDPISNLPPPPS